MEEEEKKKTGASEPKTGASEDKKTGVSEPSASSSGPAPAQEGVPRSRGGVPMATDSGVHGDVKRKAGEVEQDEEMKGKRTRQGKKKREEQREAWMNGKSMQKD